MFLVLNTSGLTIIPVSIMVYRAQLGAAQPTDVFIPLLLTTFFSTLVGLIATSLYQRINLLQPVLLGTLGAMSVGVAALMWGFSRLDGPMMNLVGTTTANVLLFTIVVLFIVAGLRRKVNVYDAFIEGAKGGFETAVRIIPSSRGHARCHRRVSRFGRHGLGDRQHRVAGAPLRFRQPVGRRPANRPR